MRSHVLLSFLNSQNHLLSVPYMETVLPEVLVLGSLSVHSQAILSVCSVLLQTLAVSTFLFLCVSFSLASSLVAWQEWDDGGSLLFSYISHDFPT